MITRSNLLNLKDLKLSGRLEHMDEKQLFEYCQCLDDFIETYPAQEKDIKNSFERRDFDVFSKTLLDLRNLLTLLYADDLANGCLKLLSDIKAENQDTAEAYLNYFLTALSALSIDIQMAQAMGGDGDTVHPNLDNASTAENGRQKIVLAVDDVPLILSGLKTILTDTQFKFAGVTSATAALKYIREHTPDLFILDIEMPEMDGYELADRIRKAGHKAPIIFLTGNSTKDYVLKAIRAGAADFIVKPVNREQVLAKIIKFTL